MIPELATNRPTIIYDGACGLCNFWVKRVVKADKKHIFELVSNTTVVGIKVLKAIMPPINAEGTVVLILEDRVYTKSDAVINICRSLGWPYRVLAAAVCIPKPVRNWLYDVVARNRYRFFKQTACMLPPTRS